MSVKPYFRPKTAHDAELDELKATTELDELEVPAELDKPEAPLPAKEVP